MPAMRFTFNGIVNGAVLAVCLMLGVNISLQLRDRLAWERAAAAANVEPYRIGDALPLGNYDFAAAPATLVLAVRSSCKFCTESMPFYGRLAHDLHDTNPKIQIVAVSTDSEEVLTKYFESNNVQAPVIRTVTAEQLRISGTPTILLVDGSGVIQGTWIGLLKPDQHAVVLSEVRRVSKRSES